MSSFSIDSLERLSLTELVGLVRGLIGEVERLREENEKLNAALASTKRENQQLKDEIRRLKGLPPRPPIKPSGMEKATDRLAAEKPSEADAPPPRRRGPGVSKLSIDGTVTLTAPAPAGSRHKGYEEIIVQDIAFKPEVTLYRRERRTTQDGRTVAADLPAGVVGGCGPNLHRLVLVLHFQGQMTCERIVAVLTAAGLLISKRQVVRLLTARLDLFRAEEEAVFSAGLRAPAYVSVDDTGARHAGKACSCACSSGRRFRSTPTHPKMTFASSSPSEKSQAEPSAKADASPATSCSASPRPAPSSKSHSSITSATASKSQDHASRPSKASSRPFQHNPPAPKSAPVTTAPIKSLILFKANSHAKMAPDSEVIAAGGCDALLR